MNKGITALSGLFLFAWSGLTIGQDLIVFPAGGQDAEQQGKDEYECYGWAKNQSGFDPMALPTASEPPPQAEAQQGGAGRSAARGAAGGAAVGAIVGDSDSAKKGAAAGALVGGARRSGQNKQQAQQDAQKQANWEQEQAQQYAAARTNYNRAYGACLEGKDYTVK
jgi:hypothetical protein